MSWLERLRQDLRFGARNLARLWPARRAARIDAATALREE